MATFDLGCRNGLAAGPDQTKRGKYLARAGDCISWQTAAGPDAPPYAGGLAVATPQE